MKNIIDSHKFFVRESKLYIGKVENDLLKNIISTNDNGRDAMASLHKISFIDKLYYPIAYIKFMFYQITEN